MDFGCARKLNTDGKTEKITDKDIFTTLGYSSPEILYGNNGELQLTPATDIYSVGELMVYLARGMRYKKSCGKDIAQNVSIKSLPVKDMHLKNCGYRPNAAAMFKQILTKALKRDPYERYQNAHEMLIDIQKLKKMVEPPKFILPQNLSRTPYFVEGSRDKELAVLQKEIDNGAQVLWIWDVGGIGKTELAMEFARLQIENRRPSYMVNFAGSMKETIMQMNFSGWSFEASGVADPAVEEYIARLDLLKENYWKAA